MPSAHALRLNCAKTIVAALAIAVAGCWPFHKSPTPQQQFIEALNRGDGPKASEIWLKMTPEDRLKFAHSQGMAPAIDPQELKKKLLKHYAEENGVDLGESTFGEQGFEPAVPNVSGGGLQDLPKYIDQSGGAAAPSAAGSNQ